MRLAYAHRVRIQVAGERDQARMQRGELLLELRVGDFDLVEVARIEQVSGGDVEPLDTLRLHQLLVELDTLGNRLKYKIQIPVEAFLFRAECAQVSYFGQTLSEAGLWQIVVFKLFFQIFFLNNFKIYIYIYQ